MKTIAWAILIEIAGRTVALPAEQTNATYSVPALVQQALEKNPELKFYDAELQAAKASVKAAGQWANPEVSSSAGRKQVRASDASGEGLAWSVSVMQPFEWPGRIGLRKAIANRDLKLALLGIDRFKTALASRVRVLAYTVYAKQQKAAAAEDVGERFRLLREVLVQRDLAGITPLLETRVIEATELNMRRKATERVLEMQYALLELNQIRGANPAARLAVQEGHLKFRQPDDLDHLLALASTNNFELRVREIELAQQGLRLALSRNERFPALRIGPMYSDERAADRERILGVAVSAPLPLWTRNRPQIEIAQARETQAQASLLVVRRETERNVTRALLEYQRKLLEMSEWRPDSTDHFRQAAELADRHYRLGAVPVNVYIEMQEKYLDAVESLVDTKKETLAAAAELELLTGLKEPLVSLTDDGKTEPNP